MPTSATAPAAPQPPAAPELLHLRIGDQAYGIDVGCVQEIRAWERPTRLAHAPACVLGVINLRGAIVPIVDPRPLLGGVGAAAAPTPVVVMLGIGRRTLGLAVDAVSDVLPQAEPATAARAGAGAPVQAVAALGERLLPLLDGEALLAALDGGAGPRL